MWRRTIAFSLRWVGSLSLPHCPEPRISGLQLARTWRRRHPRTTRRHGSRPPGDPGPSLERRRFGSGVGRVARSADGENQYRPAKLVSSKLLNFFQIGRTELHYGNVRGTGLTSQNPWVVALVDLAPVPPIDTRGSLHQPVRIARVVVRAKSFLAAAQQHYDVLHLLRV